MSERRPEPREVGDIVEQFLREHGFDGLWNFDGECACELSDISPAACMTEDCKAGYRQPCDCGDHEWHIGDLRVPRSEEVKDEG